MSNIDVIFLSGMEDSLMQFKTFFCLTVLSKLPEGLLLKNSMVARVMLVNIVL
jgi:hypothetical protein